MTTYICNNGKNVVCVCVCVCGGGVGGWGGCQQMGEKKKIDLSHAIDSIVVSYVCLAFSTYIYIASW